MSQHQTRFFVVALALAMLTTFCVYFPGLEGGFIFDDYPQIVINGNLSPFSSWQDMIRIAASGNAGPGGRPIALITFAAQIRHSGLDPYFFKLFNVIVHCCNGILLFGFLRALFIAAIGRGGSWGEGLSNRSDANILVVSISVLWLLSPMCLTSVLYAVQRMTSLSATFTLLGLWGYVAGRYRNTQDAQDQRGNLLALISLSLGTLAAYFTKEIGALTLLYAWIVEASIFGWRSANPRWQRLLAVLRYLPWIALLIAIGYVTLYMNLPQGYQGRSFTLAERCLTQTRILWFYIFQILLPNASWFSLYHDDFVVSKGLVHPWTTAFALIGHISALGLALIIRRRYPIITLGIFWFYGGHLLESSVFPLELVFEHRNYLPMLGPLTIASWGLWRFGSVNGQWRAVVILFSLWILGLAGVTGIRAASWGDPLHAIIEAERHPNSARANFDAGMAIFSAIRDKPELLNEYYSRAVLNFDRSIAADPDGIAPFAGIMGLAVMAKKRLDDSYFAELENRLRNGVVHNNVVFSLHSLNELLFLDTPYFNDNDAERLYRAYLENPRTNGVSKAHALIAYAFLLGRQNDRQGRLAYLRIGLDTAPHIHEFRLLYIAELMDLKRYDEARGQLAELHRRDTLTIYGREAQQLESQLPPLIR